MRASVATARESREATARLAGQLLPHEHEGAPQAVDLLATDDELGLVDKEVANVVAIVRPNVAKLATRDIRAVGVALNAAAKLTRRTVLLTAPDVLGLLEGLRLLVLRQRRVVAREVLEEGGLVHLGARGAAGAAVHVHRELAALGDASASLGLGVARDDARELDVEVHVVRHVADAVEEDLALLAERRHGRERLRHRLDREAGVATPRRPPEGGGRVARKLLVDEAHGQNIVVGA